MFINALTGAAVSPSFYSYQVIPLVAPVTPVAVINVTLSWPTQFLDIPVNDTEPVTQAQASYYIKVYLNSNSTISLDNGFILPPANQGSPGQAITFINASPEDFIIYANDGVTSLATLTNNPNANVITFVLEDNTTTNGVWTQIGLVSASGGFTTINTTSSNTPNLLFTNSVGGSTSNLAVALGGDLLGLTGFSTIGIPCRTSTLPTWQLRTLTGTLNQVTVTNGDGVGGNPEFSLPPNINGIQSVTANNISIGLVDVNVIASTNVLQDIVLKPNGANVNLALGAGLTFTSIINSHTLIFTPPSAGYTSNVTLALPPDTGATGQVLGLTAPNTLGWLNVPLGNLAIYTWGQVTFTSASNSITVVTTFPSVPMIIPFPNTAGAAFTAAQLGVLQVNNISIGGFTITNTGIANPDSAGLTVSWIAVTF